MSIMSIADILIIIAPVFVIILLGLFLGRTPLFESRTRDDKIAATLIRYVNFIAIPALLIRSLAPRGLPDANEFLLITGYYAAMYAVYFVTVFGVAVWLRFKAEERVVGGLIACFANIGFVGLPIAEQVFGDEGLRLFLVIMSFHSLTLIPTTLILLAQARKRHNRASRAFNPMEMVRTNPVLVSLILGLGWAASGLPFPLWLDAILALPAQSAAPVGLFVGGLALSRLSLEGKGRDITVLVLIKLLVMPVAVWITTRYLFGLSALYVAIAVLLAGMPSGLIPYMLATTESVAPRRAASALLLSVIIAPVTLSIILYLIGNSML